MSEGAFCSYKLFSGSKADTMVFAGEIIKSQEGSCTGMFKAVHFFTHLPFMETRSWLLWLTIPEDIPGQIII